MRLAQAGFDTSSSVQPAKLQSSPMPSPQVLQLLLLEDDSDLGQAVSDHLRAAGPAVHWCQRIAEARCAPPPMLALLDLRLPDGDGLDLLREWRAAGKTRPVIALTVRDQVSDRIRGLQAGADDYMVKPFDLDELLARIDAVLRRVPVTLPGTELAPGALATRPGCPHRMARCRTFGPDPDGMGGTGLPGPAARSHLRPQRHREPA